MNLKKEIGKDNLLYLVLIAIPSVLLIIYNPKYALLALILIGLVVLISIRKTRTDQDYLSKELKRLSSIFESISKQAIFNMPFPLVLVDNNGIVIWHNTPFQKLTEAEVIVNKEIDNILPELDLKTNKEDKNGILKLEYMNKFFDVHYRNVETGNQDEIKEEITMYYFVDSTETQTLKDTLNAKSLAMGLVFIDNYDDIRNSMTDINRNLLFAELDNIVKNSFQSLGGSVKKFEKDKYIVIMERATFKLLEEKRFDVLDRARDLYYGNQIPVTLSLGFSSDDDTPKDLYEKAESAVNVALGRGGDQAVVETAGQFKFYGGKSKAVEKRNKVKARVISYALKQLIETSDNVFVMGHKNPDMDAIGSAIGVLRAIEDCEKEGYIITYGENPSIKNLYEVLRKDGRVIIERFKTPDQAKPMITKNSLLIVVDNHKPSMVECPDILDLIPRTVLIDHHRRGSEFLKDPLLIYLEPYASSTSELVTEILTYMSDKINLTKLEAECLLAGITVDTKNFTFQTGVRTFEAASTLKSCGADSQVVSQLFRDDYKNVMARAKILQDTRVINENIALSKSETISDDAVLIAAEAANELLNINGIEASFVVVKHKDQVHVSGRSYGNISVQLILEDLGGGGHLTSAGAQFDDKNIDEVEESLLKAIEKYVKEDKKDESNIN